MGRTKQTGLYFFPFDVGFFDDDKILLIEEKFGVDGAYVLVRLLCTIYKNGYYYQWGEDECRLFVRKLGHPNIDRNFVDELIREATTRDFFDKRLFEENQILTSHGIQKRYLEATKRYKSVILNKDYLLIPMPARANVGFEEKSQDMELPFIDEEFHNQIYEVFFFKNFPEPFSEISRFCAYYEARGWMDSNGNTITDKLAVAKFWEPAAWRDKKQERVFNCPVKLLSDWKKVYDKIKSEIGEEIYSTFLQLKPLTYSGGKLMFLVPDEKVYEVIEDEYIEVFKKSLHSVYGPNIKVEYSKKS